MTSADDVVGKKLGTIIEVIVIWYTASHDTVAQGYESIFLPSTNGAETLLNKAGFNILEISTPGTLDIEHVLKNSDQLKPDDLFTKYLLTQTDRYVLAEFQRFLQKSGMSSHARIIAQKV